MSPHLVPPSSEYKESFLAAVREYQAEKLPYYSSLNVAELTEHFEVYVQQLRLEAEGINLHSGFVPHTTLWLVKDSDYIGRVDIRHELNEYLRTIGGHVGYDIRPSERRKGYGTLILELALKKTEEMGLAEVLITCDVSNVGSNKIIQANGGQKLDTYPQGQGLPDKVRYLLKQKPAAKVTSI